MLSTQIVLAAKFYKLVEFNLSFFMIIFNMLVLFGFLTWKLFKPVSKLMEDRTNKIKKSFDDAENKLKEADDLRKSYIEKLDGIKDERDVIIKEAVEKANKLSDEIKEKTENDIKIMKEKAVLDIEADREKMMNEAKDEIASIALLIASKILEKELKTNEKDIVINDFINKVGDVKWDK
ncbi:MAG: ATP synthase F0 subunit B [Clostridiales bacterium]|nr:MAG: ATP synthase F0 subunit B [Clostridiales bacterium]